jgi:hypothetical protein
VTEGDNSRNPDHSREYWRRNSKTQLVSIIIRLFKNSKTFPKVNNPSKLWDISGKGITPQDYGRLRFHPASKLMGIQRRFL